jgi:putative ABC transport system permease protein
MIQNYLIVALRNITRHSSYTIINVLGLALGMTCALLIFSLVSHHLSYDNYHPELDRVYRIVTEQHRDQVSYTTGVPSPLGKVFRDDYTYAEKVGRMATFGDELVYVTENGETKKFIELHIALAEPDIFEIFNIAMLHGEDVNKLLIDPRTAIITESVAKKYFGTTDAIDRVFKIGTRGEYRVAGIMKDIPDNTDLRSEVYLPYSALKTFNDWMASDDAWAGITSDMQAFVRLKPGVDVNEVEQALFGYVKKFRPTSKNVHHYKLQPMDDVHFNAQYSGSMSMRTIVALSIIGFFLIITACVNFVNLATARASGRSREIGVRKVLGGVRSQILWQFMAETFVITMVSIFIAVAAASALLPVFNEQFRSRLSLNLFEDWRVMAFLPLLLMFVTFVAGFYPGVVLSGFQAAKALKGKLSDIKTGGMNLRRALIVTQFSISQILVIVLIVVVYQVHYSNSADLGFDREAVVMIGMGSQDQKGKSLKAELENISGVEQVSMCWDAPASLNLWKTAPRFGNRDEDENFSTICRVADENYISLFNIELIAGRNLTPSDTLREFLVNETFVDKLGLQPADVIGEKLRVNGEWIHPIVGVIKDFHASSFHEEITPVFIGTKLDMYNAYAVKLKTSDLPETLKALEAKWTEMYPDLIYDASFLDENIAYMYETEETMLKLVQMFSFVAILVGCMGLFGLVSFMSIQRTKEIGIRKVLGGSISHILWLFGKEFSFLIALSFVVAAPIGYWLMSTWLEDYVYHVPLDAWILFAAVGVTFTIAILTVGYRSMKAATANPVNSLRAE